MPEPTAQSSFIPHEGDLGVRSRLRPSGLITILVLISIVLLVASCVLAGGVFLYQQYLQQTKTSKVDQLERAKDAFEPTLIQELTRLDNRMKAANSVLAAHIAPSVLFHTLEQSTITTLAFLSFNYDGIDPSKMNIKMNGVAQSVNSIALQADLFSKSSVFTSPIFSNIDRQLDGVHFSVAATLNPAALNYEQLIASGGAQTQPAAQTQPLPPPQPQGTSTAPQNPAPNPTPGVTPKKP